MAALSGISGLSGLSGTAKATGLPTPPAGYKYFYVNGKPLYVNGKPFLVKV